MKLFKSEKITHSYPHCWRCETPLLNYAASSWFVKVTAIKNKFIKNNQKIHCPNLTVLTAGWSGAPVAGFSGMLPHRNAAPETRPGQSGQVMS